MFYRIFKEMFNDLASHCFYFQKYECGNNDDFS